MAKVNLPLMIGRRYSRAKRRNGFISFIASISMIGIGLGVWVLITVISIMNGFGNELRGRILDVTSHVTVSGPSGWLEDWKVLEPTLQSRDDIEAYAPYIYMQGLLSNGAAVSGAMIRGVEPEREENVSSIAANMNDGSLSSLQPGEYNIVLGELLALSLRAEVGDKVTLISPQGTSSPAGLTPRLRRFNLVGTFEMGMNEYDGTLAIINIVDAAKLFKAGDQVTGLRLKLDDVYKARQVGAELQRELGFQFYVDNWTRQHENFFRALEIERRVMFIVLFLIVAVAAFNIVSTLVMVVTDKKSDIAILRTIGMSPRQIMGIFFVQGATSGFIGTFAGAIAGILTALNVGTIISFIEDLVGHQVFPADVYVITDFPAELTVSDVSIIVIASLVISMLATLYPAWTASKTQPAEALRDE